MLSSQDEQPLETRAKEEPRSSFISRGFILYPAPPDFKWELNCQKTVQYLMAVDPEEYNRVLRQADETFQRNAERERAELTANRS